MSLYIGKKVNEIQTKESTGDPYRTDLMIYESPKLSFWDRIRKFFFYEEINCKRCQVRCYTAKPSYQVLWATISYSHCEDCNDWLERTSEERFQKREFEDLVEKEMNLLKAKQEARRRFEIESKG